MSTNGVQGPEPGHTHTQIESSHLDFESRYETWRLFEETEIDQPSEVTFPSLFGRSCTLSVSPQHPKALLLGVECQSLQLCVVNREVNLSLLSIPGLQH